MTVTHVGATKKYVAGWESIFGGQGKKSGAGKKKAAPPSAKKKPRPAAKARSKKSRSR